ncbi:MAG TPA: hypothetical protein DCG85_02000 [Lachnospiraceae bacterium]|nr:hypothetical protein [Lachnospiraceae bacterium]
MLKEDINPQKGYIDKLGLSRVPEGLSVVIKAPERGTFGMIFYLKSGELKVPFKDEYLCGSLFCVLFKDLPIEDFEYAFYNDDKIIRDEYAYLTSSKKKFGVPEKDDKHLRSVFINNRDFDWEDDKPLCRPLNDTVIYKLHVRGFTKHASSKVKDRGTFNGLKEKIPYLLDLGINAIECMPLFDFEDVIHNPSFSKVDKNIIPFMSKEGKPWEYKTNYWGYTYGAYFAPKSSYASSPRADIELKSLIKELHKNGIEIILEFYFEADARPGFILDVCRFWVSEYHVDGFKLMGVSIPIRLLSSDPYLLSTKLIFDSLSPDKADQISGYNKNFKNVAILNQAFLYDCRKFLKSDEDMLNTVSGHFRCQYDNFGIINEITSYQGFTLNDLVSYDRKHNEANGENNRDGSDYNYSWNCGVEGKSRRKAILTLRDKQEKNALMMLMLSQGTPVLLAGDEFLNSAMGNNNPYCQDNTTSWLIWKEDVTSSPFYLFVKELIKIRKAHPILHMNEHMRQMDYISCGYPDLSYHGEQAWFPGFENYNRHLGVMYCGKYKKINKKKDDDFIYIAYNMHWNEHIFALPKLPAGCKWHLLLSSNNTKDVDGERTVSLSPRSIAVFAGTKDK